MSGVSNEPTATHFAERVGFWIKFGPRDSSGLFMLSYTTPCGEAARKQPKTSLAE
jgi:hypothetical protein